MLQTKILEILELAKDTCSTAKQQMAKLWYVNGNAQMLSYSEQLIRIRVHPPGEKHLVELDLENWTESACSCKESGCCAHVYVGLLQAKEEISALDVPESLPGHAYTRAGMIERVMFERFDKATAAKYELVLSANVFGEHTLVSESGERYTQSLHNLKTKEGYCSCLDFQHNKLGVCKHLLFTFDYLANHEHKFERKTYFFPYIEIFLDPLNEYRITWFYPHQLDLFSKELIDRYFKGKNYIDDEELTEALGFFSEASQNRKFVVRPEVNARLEAAFNEQALLRLEATTDLNELFHKLFPTQTLLPYQSEGVKFAAFKEGCILADETGLGKSTQAIMAAMVKAKLLAFRRTLVVCPVSVRNQWITEIGTIAKMPVAELDSNPANREDQLDNFKEGFLVVSYETVVKDIQLIERYLFDFVILDEAHRIKDYESKTAWSIKRIKRKHAMVLTANPIENRIVDLYSIVDFIDKRLLAPLWEFSQLYCYFNSHTTNDIAGYRNLDLLKKRLANILLRRYKSEVFKQLPNLRMFDFPIESTPEQLELQRGLAEQLHEILSKNLITAYDKQRIFQVVNKMRMAANSTLLLDQELGQSAKLDELAHILTEKLDIQHKPHKVVIVSEWKKMVTQICFTIRGRGVKIVELTGDTSPEKRNELLDKFRTDADTKILVVTEAILAGLDLNFADTLINFDVALKPHLKAQRLGSIERIGQSNQKLLVFNLITELSIEVFLAEQKSASLFDHLLADQAADNYTTASDAYLDQLEKYNQQLLRQIQQAQREQLQKAMEPEQIIHTDHSNLQETLQQITQYLQKHQLQNTPKIDIDAQGIHIHFLWKTN